MKSRRGRFSWRDARSRSSRVRWSGRLTDQRMATSASVCRDGRGNGSAHPRRRGSSQPAPRRRRARLSGKGCLRSLSECRPTSINQGTPVSSGFVYRADAIVGPVDPDEDGADQAHAGEPYHLPDGMDLRPRRPPGGDYDDGVIRPCRKVLSAERGVESRQREDNVRRGAGRNEIIGELVASDPWPVSRTDGRD